LYDHPQLKLDSLIRRHGIAEWPLLAYTFLYSVKARKYERGGKIKAARLERGQSREHASVGSLEQITTLDKLNLTADVLEARRTTASVNVPRPPILGFKMLRIGGHQAGTK
jgi:hypothetical protein